MALSKRLRFEILRRDNHLCRYCGATAPEVKLTVDHVVPTALGGGDEPGNLVTACADCNSGKSATPPDASRVDDVAEDALRWAAAIKRVAEIERQQRSDDSTFYDDFIDVMITHARRYDSYTLPEIDNVGTQKVEHKRSILQFRDVGLDMDDLEFAIVKAMSNGRLHAGQVWRYFCGVAWRMVEDRQKAALALIAEEDGSGN